MTRWVLLRGLTREARHWGEFGDRLRQGLPAAQVVALDLPGCGARRDEPSPSRIVAMLDSVRQDLQQSGLTEPVHLLGLSLGAMLATEWATRYPAQVAGCVLINTSLRVCSAFHQRLRPHNYPQLARIVLPGLDARAREALVLHLTSALGDPDGRIVDAWAAYRQHSPVSGADALRQLLAAARYAGGSTAPPVPTLVLASAGDRLVDPACSRALAARWQAALAVHPSAGHDLPLDDGDWVVGQIRDWLRSARAPGADPR